MTHRDATIREFQYFLCILLRIIFINITIKYEKFQEIRRATRVRSIRDDILELSGIINIEVIPWNKRYSSKVSIRNALVRLGAMAVTSKRGRRRVRRARRRLEGLAT